MFDFGVGTSELFVLAILAVIVIGPKDLPKVLRTFGQFMNKMRGMAREFQGHVDQAMKETGADTIKKDFQSLKETVGASKSSLDAATSKALDTSKVSMPSFPSMVGSTPAKDFVTYFGEGTKGETRVAGSLILPDGA
jgi:sec-independent protein translocase protein TatB